MLNVTGAAAEIANFGAFGFGLLLSTMLAVMVAFDRRARSTHSTR